MKVKPSIVKHPRKKTEWKVTQELKHKLEEIAIAHDCDMTYVELQEALEKATGVKLSTSTIWRIVKAEWTEVRKSMKPPLSEDQRRDRLSWALKHRRNTWQAWVDIDEKWFYLYVPRRKLKVPKGVSPESLTRFGNKRHVPKVMSLPIKNTTLMVNWASGE